MIKDKIKTLPSLLKIVAAAKKDAKQIVFTNGCFDILHKGHVNYLQKAKLKGDILIVGLNSDDSVRKIKGKTRPINDQTARAQVMAALESTDYVVIFKESTPFNLIKKIQPDVLVKGADWKKEDIVGADIIESYGGKIARIKFIDGYSTTKIIKKISE